VLGGALIGGVTVPPLIGQIINVAGPGVVPWLLAAIAVQATLIALSMTTGSRAT
jgi:hypothetical protein